MLKEIWIASTELVKFGQLLKLHQIKPLYKDYQYNLVNTITLSAYLVIQRNRMILNQDFTPSPLERTKNENKKIQYIHACTWLELKKIFRKIE